MSATQSVLHAITINDLRCLLWSNPCPQCARGPQEISAANLDTIPHHVETLCQACNHRDSVIFTTEYPLPPEALTEPIPPWINPTDEPSELLDLNQWLGLFHLFLERASLPEVDHAGHHHAQLWAAACLDEALKFYNGGDLPPESAFRRDLSRQAFAQYPQSFDHQALLDWHAKLPPAPAWPEGM
jgi:hypothetical protein